MATTETWWEASMECPLNNGKSYLSFNRGEDFLEINQSETRIACGGHVCYRDKMSNLYRGPFIYLAKGNMSFCHHLVSVVCHSFTFHILIL
jgi:hypothetical protein